MDDDRTIGALYAAIPPELPGVDPDDDETRWFRVAPLFDFASRRGQLVARPLPGAADALRARRPVKSPGWEGRAGFSLAEMWDEAMRDAAALPGRGAPVGPVGLLFLRQTVELTPSRPLATLMAGQRPPSIWDASDAELDVVSRDPWRSPLEDGRACIAAWEAAAAGRAFSPAAARRALARLPAALAGQLDPHIPY